jgi:DNA-binding GntR family transcriptional regulator
VAKRETTTESDGATDHVDDLVDRESLARRISQGYSTVSTLVYEALRDAITAGAFLPGEVLRQESLAASLGVSRAPVRAAIRALADDGLVEMQERRGAVVRRHTPEQVKEIYAIRSVLERHALVLSLARMTPERIARLRRLSGEAERSSTSKVDARVAVYRELYDAEHNPELVKVLEELRLKLGRYIFAWRRQHSHKGEHDGIIDAIERGDHDRALELVEHNLAQVCAGIISIIESESESALHRRRSARRPRESA